MIFFTNLLLCPTSWCSSYKSSVRGGTRRPSPKQEPRFQGSSGELFPALFCPKARIVSVYGGLALRVLELLEALWVSFEFKHPRFHACAAATASSEFGVACLDFVY